MSENYALLCPDFKFYWPNGVPDYAKKCCLECVNLDETDLIRIGRLGFLVGKDQRKEHAIHCLLHGREVKREAWKQSHAKGQLLISQEKKAKTNE